MSCFNPADEYWYPVTFDENGRTVQDFRNNLYTGAHEDDGVEVPDFKPELFEHDLSFNESNCLYSDGYKHAVITINDQSPGPVLEVTQGALVHVTIINDMMGGAAATIHFHGFKFAKNYYWYDGVEMITQCPIPSGQKFTYSFIASEAGIRWYHGHGTGLKVDGLFGSSKFKRGSVKV